jgi:cyclopropane fatty-acyl-phospholipid synthase-like methyltransferase
MYAVEKRHWWYAEMPAITRSLLTPIHLRRSQTKILDAGGGTGAAMRRYLSEYGQVTGWLTPS